MAVKGGREWSPKVRTENLPGGGFCRRLFQYPYFTAQLLQPSPYDRSESRSLGLVSAPVALAAGLLGLCLYAAFAHGAVAAGDEERLQLAVAGVAVVAAVAWLWSGTLALAAPRAGWIALGLLAAFAFWSGLTLLLERRPRPDVDRMQPRDHLRDRARPGHRSRRLTSTGAAPGRRRFRARRPAGERLCPGTEAAARDQDRRRARASIAPARCRACRIRWATGTRSAPSSPWGSPPCSSVVLDVERARRLRLAGSVAILVMLVTIGFTYSRGAVLALAVAVAVIVFGTPGRLRALLWLGICLAAAVPVTVVGLASAPLTAAGAGLGSRERAGAELLILLIACRPAARARGAARARPRGAGGASHRLAAARSPAGWSRQAPRSLWPGSWWLVCRRAASAALCLTCGISFTTTHTSGRV